MYWRMYGGRRWSNWRSDGRSNWFSIWNWQFKWWFFHFTHVPFIQDDNVSYDWGNESVPNDLAQLCETEQIRL
jgi:hypothetical protein